MTALEDLETLVAALGSEDTGYSVDAKKIPIVKALQKTLEALQELDARLPL